MPARESESAPPGAGAKSPTRSPNFTNNLNTACIVLSFVLAFVLPFELFIVVYVLLGPLHYLTEIGWLHGRGYFVKGNNCRWWLYLLAILVTISLFITKGQGSGFACLTLIALMSSLIFLVAKTTKMRIALVVAASVIAPVIVQVSASAIVFGLYLSTLIHVFCFTALFMLLGALKERSVSGIVSFTTLMLCAINLLTVTHPAAGYQSAEYFLHNAKAFGSLEKNLAGLLGWSPSWDHSVQAMRFVAFAYTYHYLNWFSKTKVISWHKLHRRGWLTIVAIYVASLALYAYDFRLGLQGLFVLSIAHVYLEFPLNWWSIGAIGKEIKAIAKTGAGGESAGTPFWKRHSSVSKAES